MGFRMTEKIGTQKSNAQYSFSRMQVMPELCYFRNMVKFVVLA